MTPLSSFLDDLAHGAAEADRAEGAYRADFARQVALLADNRAVAFRRLNLLTALSETVGRAEDPAMAAVFGLANLRARLGWGEDEGVRAEIAQHFAPVCRALFHAGRVGEDVTSSTPPDEAAEEPENHDPAAALASFEEWYRERVGSSFWILFANPMPDTPLVDF